MEQVLVAATLLTLSDVILAGHRQPQAWKAQSESTACSKVFSELPFVLNAKHRYKRNARHSKAMAVKKARMPIKTGG